MNSKKLGELYSFLPKSKIKAGDGLGQGTYPFYTSSTLQSKWLNEHQYNTRAIILGTGGKPNLHFVDGPFSISTDCIALCSKQEEVNIEYTYHYLASQIHLIERGFKGSGLKHISKDYVANLVVTFPDLETQNKIVAILKRTDSLLAKREKTIAIYDRLLQATFWEMFKKYEGENTTKLSEVADIKSGLTMGKDYVGQVTSFVPYMRVANVQDGYLDFAEVKKIEASPDEVSRFQLEFDDLLLTEGGDHDTLGRGSLWKNQITGCIFQNHIFRVRVKEKEKINPTFLSYQTASVYGKRYFLKSAKQTTGIASINTTQLKNFPVYIPPKILQDKFASIVSRVDSIKKVLIANLNYLQNINLSIAQLAFKGELAFNTAVDLEVLLENDYEFFSRNSSVQAIQLLIDRIDNKYPGSQKFYDRPTYEKAKSFIFHLLKDKRILQVFDEHANSIRLIIA